MEKKDAVVTGGVLIRHAVVEGQHHYEIKKVLQNKMTYALKSLRKGDKLLKINDISLCDLPPEVFAEMLTESTPKLTVYQSHVDAPEEKFREHGGLRPFSKENTVLSFSLDLCREGDPDGEVEESGGSSPKVTMGTQLDELLMVAMSNASITVIIGRGCDKQGHCQAKHCSQCHQNEVLMKAGSSKITQVLREIKFIQEKVQDNIFIQSLMYDKYIQNRYSLVRMSSRCMSNSVKITIYYYKSARCDGEFTGIPVVLNFSGTDCFLKCVKSVDKPALSIESCDKNKLRSVCEDDEDILGFLFYMKAVQPDTRHFESVSCSGWYLHAKKEHVEVERFLKEDVSFYFLIERG